MKETNNAKPATADTVNGLQNIEQLGGRLDMVDSKVIRHLQVARLRRFAVSAATATILAPMVFGQEASG